MTPCFSFTTYYHPHCTLSMGTMKALVKLVVCALAIVQIVDGAPSGETSAAAEPSIQKTDCRNYNTDFTQSTAGWIAENTAQDTYTITDGGIQMNLVPPTQYIRMHDANSSK